MASRAICWELSGCVVRSGCGSIIAVVTGVTSVRCVRIVAVVASVAIIRNRYVRTYEWINRIVVKRRWRPGGFAVASRAIRRELSCGVVRGCCGGVVAVVTGVAGIGRGIVISVVAGRAIAGNGGVRAVQGVVIIVNWEGGRFPAGGGGMTHRAVRWDG